MKKKQTKKSLSTFSKRNTHKRKARARAKAEALRAASTAQNAPISKSSELVAEGIFSSAKGGYGFVAVEGERRDVFIPDGKTLGAIEGDKVEIVYRKFKSRLGEDKIEGRVRRIIAFGKRTLIGTVIKAPQLMRRHMGIEFLLKPDDTKISIQPAINSPFPIQPGEKLEAKLLRRGSAYPECTALKSFGDTNSKEANYNAILSECEIITDFTREEQAEARYFASMPVELDGREDFTKEIIFTIDGAGAKDLDDAISLRRLKGGEWLLGVHIADVSHYVRERTHLDRAAMARGTSVYFTDKVVPMLPKELSNGACSLNAGENKYALSAKIRLSREGEIISCRLVPSVIKSRVRGIYSEVNEIFEGTASEEILKKYREVIPTLEKMHELYLVLKKKSEARGALELDSPEAEIILDAAGRPTELIKRVRGDGERLIEQFMLTANEAVATLLKEEKIPCVYRIHEPPPEEKLYDFLTYVHNLGFDTSYVSKTKCAPRDFRRLLLSAEEKGLSMPVSYTMLRSMSKAKYSDENIPHFGLGIEKYCHFTSPIRRLSDLATHRIIHKVLLEGKRPELYASYAKRAAAAASEAELRAQSAERRIESLYKVIYMSDFLGEVFDAQINSVTSFGFFCMPENTCEGLVPISELGGEFIFDEKTLTLRSGERRYRLGDKIKVRLEEADIIRGKLRYSVVEE